LAFLIWKCCLMFLEGLVNPIFQGRIH
jgi:hypothetical protein